jgi:metal-responsive CopG/Arc/MetJ family transcriptional regulator
MDNELLQKRHAILLLANSNTKKFSFTIPEKLHDAFHEACRARGDKMSPLITEWIKKYLEGEAE